MEAPSFKSQVHRGIKWVAISTAFERGLHFITTAVLTYFLAPEAFGLIAMAYVSIDLLDTLRRIGFGAAYIQRPEKEGEDWALAANTLFWIVLGVNTFLFAIAWALAPLIADYFKDDGLILLLRLMFAVFLVDALNTVPNSDLQKRLEFRKIAYCEIAQGLVHPVIGVSFAVAGAGVWSLVFAFLGQRVVFTLMMLKMSRWAPRLAFSRGMAAELFQFGKYMWGHVVVLKVAGVVDRAIIGRFFGAASLGFYSNAFKLCSLPGYVFSLMVSKVTFPAFSKIQDDAARLKAAFTQTLSHVSLVALPLAGGLLAMANQLPGTIFAPNWAPMVPYVKILALYSIASSMSSVTGSLFMAMGRPKVLLYVSVPQNALMIALFFVLTPFGVRGICYAVVIPWALFSVVYFAVACRLLRAAAREMVEPILRPALAAAAMYGAIELLEPLLLGRAGVPAGVLFAGFIIFGMLVYTAASLVLNRRAIGDVMETGRSILAGRDLTAAPEQTGGER